MTSNDSLLSRKLTDVLIFQFVAKSYPLWLMFHRFTIHNCRLELFYDGPVNGVALKYSPTRSVNIHLFLFLSFAFSARHGTGRDGKQGKGKPSPARVC